MNAEAGPPPEPLPGTAPSAGALLKAAREKQGLHIAALAAAIKVSPRKLEALEADRLDELPDATFARALAQTVCRTLKVDARPVLDRLPPAGPQQLVPPDAGLNQPFREGPVRNLRQGDDAPLSALTLRPMVLGALVLLVASVALWLLPPMSEWGRDGPVQAPAPALAPAASSPMPAATPAESAASAVGSAAVAASSAAQPAASAAAVAAAPMAETVFSSPPPGTDGAAPVAPALLQLRVSEASWIEVRDARGVTLLSRTVSPGEQVGLNGTTPLALVVGNAAATELVFQGRPVDLAARSRDNVARFQLP